MRRLNSPWTRPAEAGMIDTGGTPARGWPTRECRAPATRLAVAAVLLGALAGCATLGGGIEKAEVVSNRVQQVEVDNQNWAQIDVFAVREGLSIRLGTVNAAGMATFVLPVEMRNASDARLVVEPLAARIGYVSPPIPYDADMKLTVTNQISLSTLVPWTSTN